MSGSSRYDDRRSDRHRDSRDSRDSGRSGGHDRYERDERRDSRYRSSREDDDRRSGSRRSYDDRSSRREEPRHYSSRDDRGGGSGGYRGSGASRDYDRPRGGGAPGRMDGHGYAGGGGGGSGGGDRRPRERSRSPVRPREPTPDLTDVVPILERKRRQTMWDVKPPGYESISAEQAKLSGLFPLPGAPRAAAPADAEKLKAFVEKGLANKLADLQPSSARQARRVVVENLPPLTEESALIGFFNDIMFNLNVGERGKLPCLSAQINKEKAYALVELRTSEEATCTLAFDGVSFNEAKLAIRRPRDYIEPEAREEEKRTDVIGPVQDSPSKIMIRGLPTALAEEHCIELLKSFGELKSFLLVKDSDSGESKGFAFCDFSDPSATEIACEGLNGMELGESPLSVQRACLGAKQVAPPVAGLAALSALAESEAPMDATKVLVFFNMVTAEELNDPNEYQDICKDVQSVCDASAPVVDIKIPKPSGGSKVNPGVGKVFVRFADEAGCTAAMHQLAGRKFSNRTILATFFPEESYEAEAF